MITAEEKNRMAPRPDLDARWREGTENRERDYRAAAASIIRYAATSPLRATPLLTEDDKALLREYRRCYVNDLLSWWIAMRPYGPLPGECYPNVILRITEEMNRG